MYRLNINEEGFEEFEEEEFETREEAQEYMDQINSNYHAGMEVLNLSNPGDYPYDEDDDIDYEIVEVDDVI